MRMRTCSSASSSPDCIVTTRPWRRSSERASSARMTTGSSSALHIPRPARGASPHASQREGRAGRIDEALEAGRAAVTRVPDGFHQRMALGFAELYAGRYAEAAADFERAERVFSHYEVLQAGWGDALIALDRPLEALAKYEDAIFENKRLGEAWRGMGVALTRLGRAEEALAKFEQAVAVDPNDPATYRAWADTLAGLGEHIEAEA